MERIQFGGFLTMAHVDEPKSDDLGPFFRRFSEDHPPLT